MHVHLSLRGHDLERERQAEVAFFLWNIDATLETVSDLEKLCYLWYDYYVTSALPSNFI